MILIGTVVDNPILIAERALQLVRGEADDERGGERWLSTEAILEAVRSRIRPIFLTTFTSVLGLLPLVLFPNAGSELYCGPGSALGRHARVDARHARARAAPAGALLPAVSG